jgi:DNA-binding CsgD family transcriptional regulator
MNHMPQMLQSKEDMYGDTSDSSWINLNIARSLFNWSGLCLANLDPAHRLVEANVEFFQHFGGSSHERQGQSFYDLIHPASQERVRRKFDKLAQAGYSHFTEQFIGIGPRKRCFTGMMRGIAVCGDNGLMNAIVVMVRPDEVATARAGQSANKSLTELDARILEGVAAGASTIQLASRLHMSRQGIEYRVAAMLRKYKVPNRPALVSRAYAIGVLCAGSWPPQVLTDCVR